ncbi:capsular polysaccharide biosynthesis protein CapF [Acholeplasma laidlawii]|uniref:capsular polysaccharide biosynthesis protein CapF n=1 Tax=Acholeplasma laidlawii TaxID=2148 RepID=UPI0021F7E229|nr:capsular polysaccharide biosynthesis protein CapF [Acholeplasma laidlawii]
MKILVTGSKGFIGKNLIVELKNQGYKEIYEYDIDSTLEDLDKYTKDCEFVFHLAGVNRPKEEKEFIEGNFGFTSQLLDSLIKHNNKSSIMLSSSIQADYENPYGLSKKKGEDLLFNYGKTFATDIYVYRFPNVFGKWCRPNYNSAVATFSHNIANNLPITMNDPNVEMNLIYIDDLVNELISALKGFPSKKDNYCYVEPVHKVKLGEIANLLLSFKESRLNKEIPNTRDPFIKKLYANYLSYLPKDKFNYELKMNVDNRGSFTEFLKSDDRGQISINISKPGIVKGNHWHHTKNEKFLVVSGNGVIRFRKIDEAEVIEYVVSGNKLEVVDIPPGYTHNIENLGNTDMVTVMWANEKFDPNRPDTYFVDI